MASISHTLKDFFLLDPEVIYLNHGSFGACPKPVFETYQAWQRQLERQPVEFLGRRATALMAEARLALANFLGVRADDVVYFSNPTTAANMAARSLALQPGDEVLATDHEYGAMDRTWRFLCSKSGAKYVQQAIPLPMREKQEIADRLFAGCTARTRAIFISHITSPTALIFPVREICRRAREAGLISIVDGAHAPGQIPLDLGDLGADIYFGACHKWLCAPKGAGFLYARPEIQARLEPLVVSWGYENETPGPSQFIDYHEWQGTRDLAAFLSVPAAIQFQAQHNWDEIRQRCHQMASLTRQGINGMTGLEPISPDSDEWFSQMVTVRLPQWVEPEVLQRGLYEDFRIEVPALLWSGQPFLRVSFQAYNDLADGETLLEALGSWLAR